MAVHIILNKKFQRLVLRRPKEGTRSIQPNLPEMSVQKSVDRFDSTIKVCGKTVFIG